MSKTNFEVHMKHLKQSIGEMTLTMKFYLCLHNFSEFLWETVFGLIPANYL